MLVCNGQSALQGQAVPAELKRCSLPTFALPLGSCFACKHLWCCCEASGMQYCSWQSE
jgi:hypothetical protein